MKAILRVVGAIVFATIALKLIASYWRVAFLVLAAMVTAAMVRAR